MFNKIFFQAMLLILSIALFNEYRNSYNQKAELIKFDESLICETSSEKEISIFKDMIEHNYLKDIPEDIKILYLNSINYDNKFLLDRITKITEATWFNKELFIEGFIRGIKLSNLNYEKFIDLVFNYPEAEGNKWAFKAGLSCGWINAQNIKSSTEFKETLINDNQENKDFADAYKISPIVIKLISIVVSIILISMAFNIIILKRRESNDKKTQSFNNYFNK